MRYDFAAIEARWQAYWDEHGTFRAAGPGDASFDPDRPKFYVLDMFPYPSGVGLHVGHPLGYIATDIVARHQRMLGKNVLHPMGFDAFGLPAEQYAIETGVHPAQTTKKNIDNMRRQLRRLGLSYDWDRELATTDPGYYRWTQWVFLQLYHAWYDPRAERPGGGLGAARPIAELVAALEGEDYLLDLDADLVWSGDAENLDAIGGTPVGLRKWHELDPDQRRRLLDEHRLAYLAEVPVNWCPALGTVLANEEVTADGRSERGNHPVEKRPLRQWMLRITKYADRLADELDGVDWPEPIKLLQRNWVGRSVGAEVDFALADEGTGIRDQGSAQPGQGNDPDPRSPDPDPLPALTVFTTRPDTLFGATYMVLAPEHPLVTEIVTDERRDAVLAYRDQAARKSDIDRQADAKEKTGVFTGAYAANPVNGESIPIWIADYVMMGYGTGAIMAVPAHDARDHDFARAFDLPLVEVVSGGDVSEAAFTGEGPLVNSANDEVSLDGLPVAEAKARIIDWLESKRLGKAKVRYKLRDWLFSRQRYWGEPFPILHELDENGKKTGVIRGVPEERLPVELPPMPDFAPPAAASDPVIQRSSDPAAGSDPDSITRSLDHSITEPAEAGEPRPPLSRAPDGWKFVELDGKRYVREFNTMPQWAGSCWYYLRFCDPTNTERFVGEEAERYWMGGDSDRAIERSSDPRQSHQGHSITGSLDRSIARRPGGVDLYVGGAEHAVLHLLYARFWHKALYDLGHVSTPEPFGRLFNQGYIQAHAYTDARGVYVPADEVVERDGEYFHGDARCDREFGKMGKSLKNAVAPDDIAERYGCDTLRLYEMYLGPLDQSKVWNTQDIVGVHRFLNRLWRNLVDEETGDPLVDEAPPPTDLVKLTHQTLARVTRAMDAMSFNVAIAALIELNNALVALDRVPRWVAEQLVLMLAPMAPHAAEELWARLGHEPSVGSAAWPRFDPAMLVEDEVELPVQVMGKLRGKITVPADADEAAILDAAKAEPNVAAHLEGKTIRKTIVVPGKLVNLVAT